ncbi:hypothetical protein NDU88_006551 [Pleurodeles waltl]|uniref:Uncharacterized protein n=1 Tax=Pleurodeles waltl TaxID=8319 RepID=A0AAV7WAY2_PLEWA|nr:hypothetical protein NDU88_006551 [Pleurodeles waltl]
MVQDPFRYCPPCVPLHILGIRTRAFCQLPDLAAVNHSLGSSGPEREPSLLGPEAARPPPRTTTLGLQTPTADWSVTEFQYGGRAFFKTDVRNTCGVVHDTSRAHPGVPPTRAFCFTSWIQACTLTASAAARVYK